MQRVSVLALIAITHHSGVKPAQCSKLSCPLPNQRELLLLLSLRLRFAFNSCRRFQTIPQTPLRNKTFAKERSIGWPTFSTKTLACAPSHLQSHVRHVMITHSLLQTAVGRSDNAAAAAA
jgi:hypothetical protein